MPCLADMLVCAVGSALLLLLLELSPCFLLSANHLAVFVVVVGLLQLEPRRSHFQSLEVLHCVGQIESFAYSCVSGRTLSLSTGQSHRPDLGKIFWHSHMHQILQWCPRSCSSRYDPSRLGTIHHHPYTETVNDYAGLADSHANLHCVFLRIGYEDRVSLLRLHRYRSSQ